MRKKSSRAHYFKAHEAEAERHIIIFKARTSIKDRSRLHFQPKSVGFSSNLF